MNRVVHFEIHAEDPARAARFYSDVFGWKREKWGGPQDYWLVTTGAGAPGIDGGIVKRMGPAPAPDAPVSGYVCTIQVADLDAVLDKAVALGASIALPKHAIPGLAWQAYAKDTEGNVFGVHQHDPQAK